MKGFWKSEDGSWVISSFIERSSFLSSIHTDTFTVVVTVAGAKSNRRKQIVRKPAGLTILAKISSLTVAVRLVPNRQVDKQGNLRRTVLLV